MKCQNGNIILRVVKLGLDGDETNNVFLIAIIAVESLNFNHDILECIGVMNRKWKRIAMFICIVTDGVLTITEFSVYHDDGTFEESRTMLTVGVTHDYSKGRSFA